MTSLRDGVHMNHSLHYVGMAVDIRTRDFVADLRSAEEIKQKVFEAIKARLKPLGFDVVFEADHIHVEYDPKGIVWPLEVE